MDRKVLWVSWALAAALAGGLTTGCSEEGETTPVPTSTSSGEGGYGGGGGSGGSGGEPVGYEGAVGEVTFVGPWGGAATEIVADPTAPGRVFAIVGGQIFRSEDNGASGWTAAAPVDFEAHSLLSLPDGRLLGGTELDLLSSTDLGDSWQSIKGNIEQGFGFGIRVTSMAYDESAARLWISLANYATAPIWTLDDGQTDWQPWSPPAGWDSDPLNGTAHFTSIAVAPDPNGTEKWILATYELDFGTGGGVFCSTDSGTTFASCSAGLPAAPFFQVRVFDDVIAVAGGQIFGSAFAGIYYSADVGQSWTAATAGWSQPIANDVVRLASGDFLAATWGNGILRSSALGSPWLPVDFAGMEVNAIAEPAAGTVLAGPEQLGVHRSTDGGTSFEPSSVGLDQVDIQHACVDPAAPSSLLAALSSQNSGTVLHTAAGIDGWGVVAALPNPRFSLVSIGASGRWYVVSDGPTGQANDGIYVSADQGMSFDFLGPLTGTLMDHDIIGIVEGDGGQSLITAGQYWSGGDWSPFVMQSSDSGATWTEIWRGAADAVPTRLAATASGDLFLSVVGQAIVHLPPAADPVLLTIPEVVESYVVDVAACYSDATRLLAVGRNDPQYYAFGAYASTDGGASWSPLDFGPEPNESPIKVAFHPYDCDLVLLATSQGRLLYSPAAGAGWTAVELGAELAIRALEVVNHSTDLGAQLVLAGGGGIATVQLTTNPVYE